MLVEVEARTEQGALLSLPLESTFNGFVVEEIDGLDPVKATIVTSNFAQVDGSHHHASRREARNILMRIGLEPDYVNTNVQGLRTRLYNFFMPKAKVHLRFKLSTGLEVDISGVVESFESKLFSREPVVNLSILCVRPDFIGADKIEVSGSTTAMTSEIHIPYEGTVETGVLFKLNLDRVLSEFIVFHRPPGGVVRRFEFVSPMQSGDQLVINTVSGEKSADLIRNSVANSILYGVAPHAQWMELLPGDNHIRVQATGAPIPYTIEFHSKYGGL